VKEEAWKAIPKAWLKKEEDSFTPLPSNHNKELLVEEALERGVDVISPHVHVVPRPINVLTGNPAFEKNDEREEGVLWPVVEIDLIEPKPDNR